MKDAYTFDRDAEGLDAAYEKHVGAYDRMLDRLGLEWYRVEADVGMMGGTGAARYMAPCAAGENEVALAPGYAANVEVASADAQPVELPRARSTRRSSRSTRRGRRRSTRLRRARASRRARCEGVPGVLDGGESSARRSSAATTASTRSSSRIALRRAFRAARPEEVARAARARPVSSDRSATRMPILLDEARRAAGAAT